MDDMLGRRALSAGRLAALGATPDFHHGLLGFGPTKPEATSLSLQSPQPEVQSPKPGPVLRSGMTGDSGYWSAAWLAVRSLLWTILLPGVVAGYVPWRFFGLRRAQLAFSPTRLLGLLCIGIGIVLLVACIFEFARSGRGTLSPLDPPRRLVVRGLYRYVRNPMYLSVTTILLGEVILTGLRALAIYWALWFLAVNLFVIGYEEPTLQQRFGPSYDEYLRSVGRWLPRHPSWKRGD